MKQNCAAATAASLLVCLALGVAPTAQQRPTSEQLVERAAAYMAEQLSRLTNVVAEERQTQRTTSPRRTRSLVSDYLIVQLQPGEFTTFRDVFEVDGQPVRDRDERLQKLFLEGSRDAFAQAQAIAREGARHNIWDVGTINNPYLAMAFVQEAYRSRFRLQSPRQERDMGPDTWSLVYQEFVVPTIIKGNGNADLFARGRFWIEAATGRMVRTELRFGADSARMGFSPVEVTVDFAYDEELRLNVPAKMEEFYPGTRTGDVRGEATYGRFRRFGVQVQEE
ncbi:MAG: hypothetical protein AB7P99_16590, partial [Vicinamibacterales bacterium]